MEKELFRPWEVPINQILSTDELARIVAVNSRAKEKAVKQGRKTPVIDWMILNTSLWGLRISESAHLECGQIFLDSETSYLYLQHTKGNKPRFVFIDAIFAFYLKEHLAWKAKIGESTAPDAPFFYSHFTKTFMTPEGLRKAFKRAIKKGGINRNITPHGGRHNLGAHMAIGPINLQVLQKTLGHSSIATTQIYIHTLPEHFKDFARHWGEQIYKKTRK